MNTFKSRSQALMLVLGTAHLLIRFRAAPARVASHLPAPHAWVDQVGADTAVATLAAALLWLAALWLAVGMFAAVLAAAPGRIGSTAAYLATAMIPATLRTMVATAAGTAMLVAPLPAFAQATNGPGAPSWPIDRATATAPAWPTDQAPPAAPAWPTTTTTASTPDPPMSQAASTAPSAAVPTATHATRPPTAATPTATTAPPTMSTVAGSAPPPRSVPTTSHAPTPPPPSPVDGTPPTGGTTTPRTTPRSGTSATRNGGTVTVTPGDSLWLIAAHRLGPRATEQAIAVDWPHWYSANRAVIGDDPGLLRPGTTLHVPDETHPGGAR